MSDVQRSMTLSLFFFLATLLMSGSATAAMPADAKLTPIERSYVDLDRLVRDNAGKAEQAKLASQKYQQLFSAYQDPAQFGKMAPRDVQALFMAADTVDFYAPSEELIKDMRLDYAELVRRNAVTPDQTSTLYSALFQARKFRDMEVFYKKHASAKLPKPPQYLANTNVASNHAVLDVSPTTDAITLRHANIEQGAKIVVVSHPLCHFTQNAVRAIEADKRLERIFGANSLWVAPPDRNIDLSPFQDWNKSHPEVPISIAFNKVSWPEVRIWQTPTFLFLSNGKVVGEVIGWPAEGNIKALENEVAKLGLSKG